jgi:hypothetical protein
MTMSEGFTSPPQPARARPATVSTANLLLLLVAALYLVGFLINISVIGTMTEVYREEFAGTEAEGSESVVAAFIIGASTINLLFAAGFIVLAMLNNRGKNPARIVTWVVGAIALCCNGLGLVGQGLGTMGTGGDIDAEELERRLTEALPSWFDAANLVVMVLTLLGLLVALILLALPASNEFFRRPEPTFEPPPDYPQVS